MDTNFDDGDKEKNILCTLPDLFQNPIVAMDSVTGETDQLSLKFVKSGLIQPGLDDIFPEKQHHLDDRSSVSPD